MCLHYAWYGIETETQCKTSGEEEEEVFKPAKANDFETDENTRSDQTLADESVTSGLSKSQNNKNQTTTQGKINGIS